MRVLISIMVFTMGLASAHGAEAKDVTLKGDKKYGACSGSEILSDFFKRYPPKETSSFNLEIDLDAASDEIFVYYNNMPAYEGDITYYDSHNCQFLRTENNRVVEGDEND
ncbi:MAG: hypothetical protein GXP06_02955 [Alphaproteobacteria bacterium]|nr:hypothetical protein [Alphaproteobacteria bacterium]